MKQIILGIHGLGNKPSQELLKEWWKNSIHEGMERNGKNKFPIPFDMVYWADEIYSEPLNPLINDKDDPLFLNEHYTKGSLEEERDRNSLRIKMLSYIEEQIDKIFLNDDMSINFKNVTDKLIYHFYLDLETYYGENCASVKNPECSAREMIQNRLINKLEQYKDYKVLLIAHSMGSIIAFDVLSNLKNDLSVNTFVTIGSPLGFPVIVGRAFAEQKKKDHRIKKPHAPESILEKWFNMSDIEDKVALDHTLSDDYGENSKGLLAEDVLVYNDYDMDGKKNPHKSFGYLRTPEMSSVIDGFLAKSIRERVYQGYKYSANRISSAIKYIRNILKRYIK
ncbi:hypothetical protein ACFL7D_03755 [candidate division KSB1 bacterium]